MENKSSLSKEQLLRILDHSFDEIFVTDVNGVVVYVNSSCINHYGRQSEEMVGKRSKEMTEQNLWGPRLSPLAQQYKKRLTAKQMSCTGVDMLTTASPVFDAKGNVEFIIENVRDMTEDAGIQKEIEATQIFLNQLDAAVKENEEEQLIIENFVASSKVMQDIIRMSWKIAEVNSNVLITGDSGAGKSIIARYIHNRSPRKSGPFIEINCAALPEALIESELFGYVRGAFSGAVSQGKRGLIQMAENGTLFLDEIGELPFAVQAKLLHFIQDASYFEVGGTKEKHADCRIIAATNRNLCEMADTDKFRRDLYYRLKVFEINIPSLSERKDDIVPLINFFLRKYNEKYGLNQQLSPEAVTLLSNYTWPGNVREISNVIEQIVVMSTEGIITAKSLPKFIRTARVPSEQESLSALSIPALESVTYQEGFRWVEHYSNELRGKIVRAAYDEYKSSRKVAAALDISESAAYRLIKEYCK